jgi:hypothetical protein
MRDWIKQAKASSFLVQWMHMVIPPMIKKFKQEYLRIETELVIVPGGSFKKNLLCLFDLID